MLSKDDKAGLYLTIIVHLVILIILLIAQIGYSLKREDTFVIDFSKQEMLEEKKAQETFEKDIDKKIDDLVSSKIAKMLDGTSGVDFKNVTSSRNNSTLKDDRNTDAEKLYADAARLAKDLKGGFNANEPDEDYVATSKKDKKQENQQEKSYSGPSVLSWHLDGRKASHLPIPAYRCYGGGMVTVLIVVDNSGKVTDAKIQEETSTDDSCLRNFAIRAARASRFSSSPTAPSKQRGDIIYQFIAQ